jgi:hypothetical protein
VGDPGANAKVKVQQQMRLRILDGVAMVYFLLSPASLILCAQQGNQSIITTGAIPAADSIFVNNNLFKRSYPYRDVTGYGASGSNKTTTTGASFTSGSTTLTLAAALDFKNGQQVRIVGPGLVSVLAAPGGLAVVQKGAAGATTYQYQIACVDSKWGETAANPAVSISNGNARLTYANFNQVTWTASPSCIYYAVYGRRSGGMALLEITPNLAWYDYGQENVTQGNMAVPSTLSATPPVSAQKGFYYGTITAGGGTTTLTMDTPSGVTVGTGTPVEHDDSAGIQAAMNAATLAVTGFPHGTQDRIFFPPGNYNITQPLIPNANPVGINFYGSGAVNLLSHVNGMDIFLIENNNQDLMWQALGFTLAASDTAIHYTQSAPTVRTKIDLVFSSGSGSGGGYDTFFRQDSGQIIFNMTRSTIGNDVNLRFGEPGAPNQVDDVHIDRSDFYTGQNGTNANPGTFQFVGSGVTGVVEFSNTLIEGPVPTGTNFPWFRMANMPATTFKNVEFAPENPVSGTGAVFQAWPGLPAGGGPIVFEQSPIASTGTGGVFDFSAGTGSNPVIVLRESNATAAGGAQVWHAAADMNGFTCEDSRLSPAQTLLGGWTQAIKCLGFAGFTDNSNQLYLRGYPGADQDPVAIDDSGGNQLFHIGIGGALGGTTTVGALPAAVAGNKGQVRTVSDSSAVTIEGQTCVGGSTNTALAFSNGVVWKCF